MQFPAPDSIREKHESGGRYANPWPLALLAAVMVAGLTGLFGGQTGALRQVSNDSVSMSVRSPETLRNGMVFETIIEVTPRAGIGELVVAVSDGLWREMTINTTIPAAGQESHAHGFQRFAFGPARAGETFRFKIDGQINPPLFAGTSGEIAVFDGDRKLAAAPIRTRVLP